jgi:hypothetical protein
MVADQTLINPPYIVESVVSVSAALNGSAEENGRTTHLERIKLMVFCLEGWLTLVDEGEGKVGGEYCCAKGTCGGG